MEISLFYHSRKYETLKCDSEFKRLAIRIPGHSGIMQICFSVPILDMQGYWIPELRTPAMKIVWVIESLSAGQRAFPFISFFNSKQMNRFSAGLTNLTNDVRIRAKMNQTTCNYDFTFDVVLNENTKDFELVLDSRDYIWTEALKSWRGCLTLPPAQIPAGAWEPVYCTWYAVHAAVTQDWVEKQAAIASRMGFKTFIIDDGWCFDVMKRVSPDTISSWYEMIGDWTISEKKFPDFHAHRERIRAMGLNYLFWVAPFLIGNKSKIYNELKDKVYPEYHEGYHRLDTKDKKSVDLMLEKMKSVLREYKLDGLKIDFLDQIFPNPETPRGEETTRFIEKLAESIREIKSDALIEFRQSYATPCMHAFGTQFRAGDVPFDFTDNFHRICQIRISMGDGVPVHADPAYWHPKESTANISRHMIASLAGVPMLSMDLEKISERERRIIEHWLNFYQEHRNTFNFGKWDVTYRQGSTAYAMVSRNGESIIILQDSARLNEALEKAEKTVSVLNLSPDELSFSGAKTFDGEGNAAADGTIPLGGLGIILRKKFEF